MNLSKLKVLFLKNLSRSISSPSLYKLVYKHEGLETITITDEAHNIFSKIEDKTFPTYDIRTRYCYYYDKFCRWAAYNALSTKDSEADDNDEDSDEESDEDSDEDNSEDNVTPDPTESKVIVFYTIDINRRKALPVPKSR